MYRLVVVLFISIVVFTSAYSQQYNFTNYSINNGLSQSVVNCLFQDSQGYIWIGTQNGLNRFNGESFDVYSYNPTDIGSISNNWIYAITEDANGNIWVGTKNGLNKYLKKNNRFQRILYQTGFTYDITQYSYDILCLKNGNLVINTPPVLSVYDTKKNSFTHFQNKLTYDGAVKDIRIPIIEDSDGKIWIGSTKGLAAFSPQTMEFSYYSFHSKSGHSLVEPNITSLYQDKNGKLWTGTTSGLFNYNNTTNRFEVAQFNLHQTEIFSFDNTCIRAILKDKNDNLIVGTEGNGLYVI